MRLVGEIDDEVSEVDYEEVSEVVLDEGCQVQQSDE